MTEAPAPRSYRVTFLHVRTGVKWETIIEHAPTAFLAQRAADEALSAHLRETAGHREDWTHYGTAEV